MSLSLLVLAGAASFACLSPTHHDGDNVRCANVDQTIRLQGIDAPEMPGACRPGRRCTPGDPFAARDTLRGLTQGRSLECTQEDTDNYGRIIARCAVDGIDLSCAMIAAGQAVPRYAALDCNAAPPQAAAADPIEERTPIEDSPVPRALVPADAPVLVPADTPAVESAPDWRRSPILWVALLLALSNIVTWALFAIDKQRAVQGRSRERIRENTLLYWALLGGSPAAWLAINKLRHKSSKDGFKQPLIIITGLQIGAALGGLWWWLAG